MNLVCVFLLLAWPLWLILRYQNQLQLTEQFLRAFLLMLLPLPIYLGTSLLPLPALMQARVAAVVLVVAVVASCVWVYRHYGQQLVSQSASEGHQSAPFSTLSYLLILLTTLVLTIQMLLFLSHSNGDGSYLWAQFHAHQNLSATRSFSLFHTWLNTYSLGLWPHYLAALQWPSVFQVSANDLSTKLPYLAVWFLQAVMLRRMWQKQGITLFHSALILALLLVLPRSLSLFAQAHSFSLVLLLVLIVSQSLNNDHSLKTESSWLIILALFCVLTPLALGIFVPYLVLYVLHRVNKNQPQFRGQSVLSVIAWLCPALMLLFWQLPDWWPTTQAWLGWTAKSDHVGLLLSQWRKDFSYLWLALGLLLIYTCRPILRQYQAAIFLLWMWTLFVLFLVFTPNAWWWFTQGSVPSTAPQWAITLILFPLLPLAVHAVRVMIHQAQGLVLSDATIEATAPLPNTASIPAVQDPRPLLERALMLQQGGEIDAAKTLYQEVLQIDPLHPDAQHLLGLIALNQGALAEAEDRIQKAIQVFPEHALFYQSLADVHSKQLRFSDAVTALNQALSLDPKNLVAKTKLLAAKRKLTQQQAVNKATSAARPGYEIIVNKTNKE